MMQDEVALDEVVRHVSAQGTVPGGACDFVLLDARSPARFRGEGETLDPVGGHIPSAFNRFYQLNLDEHGRFKPAAQLRAEFLALLGEVSASRSAPVPPTAVVHQCGSGVTASVLLFGLSLLGRDDWALYDGSWSEWGADPETPKAVGP